MTTLTLYPTTDIEGETDFTNPPCNPDGWTNPANGLGTHSGTCTTRAVAVGQTKKLYVMTMKDSAGNLPNIPAGSTITAAKIYCHSAMAAGIVGAVHGVGLTKDTSLGPLTWEETNAQTYVSDGCAEAEDSAGFACFIGGEWTVDDVNNENYDFYIYGKGGTITSCRSHIDSGWVTFTYTEPVSGMPMRMLKGVGLLAKNPAQRALKLFDPFLSPPLCRSANRTLFSVRQPDHMAAAVRTRSRPRLSFVTLGHQISPAYS